MNGGNVYSVVLSCFSLYLINASLSLGHLTRSSYFDVPAAHQDSVHLLQSQLSSLGLFKLNKCKSLVFPSHRVPAHSDGSDGTEGEESLFDAVLSDIIVDTTNIDPAHHGDGLLSLQILGLLLLVRQSLLHQHHLDAHLHRIFLGFLNQVSLVRGESGETSSDTGLVSLGSGSEHEFVSLVEVSDGLGDESCHWTRVTLVTIQTSLNLGVIGVPWRTVFHALQEIVTINNEE